MKLTQEQLDRMNSTFDKYPVEKCKVAYNLNRKSGLQIETIASMEGVSVDEADGMVKAYEILLSLDAEPPEPNPVGVVLKAIATIEGVEGSVACQDVVVKECKYCLCNDNDYGCTILKETFTGIEREGLFPVSCPLKENAILIRRMT